MIYLQKQRIEIYWNIGNKHYSNSVPAPQIIGTKQNQSPQHYNCPLGQTESAKLLDEAAGWLRFIPYNLHPTSQTGCKLGMALKWTPVCQNKRTRTPPFIQVYPGKWHIIQLSRAVHLVPSNLKQPVELPWQCSAFWTEAIHLQRRPCDLALSKCAWTMIDLHSGTSWAILLWTNHIHRQELYAGACICPAWNWINATFFCLEVFHNWFNLVRLTLALRQGRLANRSFVWPWQMEHHGLGHRMWPSALSTSRAVRPQLLTA